LTKKEILDAGWARMGLPLYNQYLKNELLLPGS